MWTLAAAGVSRVTTDDRRTQPPANHLPPKRSAANPPGTYAQKHRCKKTFFSVFYLAVTFLRFLTFLFSKGFFIFKKRWQSSERQAD